MKAKSIDGKLLLNALKLSENNFNDKHNKLMAENSALRKKIEIRNASIKNSMSSIASNVAGNSPFASTPITSFAPMLANNVYAPLTIDWTILIYAYKTHGIIQTLVDQPVLDALRGGLELKSRELSHSDLSELDDVMERKGLLDVIGEGLTWARLFGGSAIVMADDGNTNDPLDLKTLAKTKQIDFYAANRWELGSAWRTAPSYQVYGKMVDSSKVITMMGKQAPYILRWQLAGWGMSELERMLLDFNQYIRVKNVIYELLFEAKVDVYKFQDFANQMLSPEGETNTNARLTMMNQVKNYNSALLLDREDEFEQKQLSFTGLAEIMREARIEIAAALRMPMTKIFGISASGFNSGEDDIENYNSMIESEVRRPARKIIKRILEILSVAVYGDIYDIDFEFKPLRVLSAKDEEVIKDQKFNRIIGLYDRGLIKENELSDLVLNEHLIGSGVGLTKPVDSGLVEQVQLADMPERDLAGLTQSGMDPFMPAHAEYPGTRATDDRRANSMSNPGGGAADPLGYSNIAPKRRKDHQAPLSDSDPDNQQEVETDKEKKKRQGAAERKSEP